MTNRFLVKVKIKDILHQTEKATLFLISESEIWLPNKLFRFDSRILRFYILYLLDFYTKCSGSYKITDNYRIDLKTKDEIKTESEIKTEIEIKTETK